MILKQGKIVEFGSIYYIKSKHGVGYKIIISFKQEPSNDHFPILNASNLDLIESEPQTT